MSIEFGASGAPPTLTKLAEIAVGAEPSQVLIDPTCSSAFVLVRLAAVVLRVRSGGWAVAGAVRA